MNWPSGIRFSGGNLAESSSPASVYVAEGEEVSYDDAPVGDVNTTYSSTQFIVHDDELGAVDEVGIDFMPKQVEVSVKFEVKYQSTRILGV